MTLGEWLEKNSVGQAEFAVRVGITQSQVSRLVTGRRRPGRRVALAIEEVTGGLVPASSWDEPAKRKPVKGRRPLARRHAARVVRQPRPSAGGVPDNSR